MRYGTACGFARRIGSYRPHLSRWSVAFSNLKAATGISHGRSRRCLCGHRQEPALRFREALHAAGGCEAVSELEVWRRVTGYSPHQ